MADIFGAIPIPKVSIAGIGLVLIVIMLCGFLLGLFFLFLYMSRQTPVMEIDWQTKRVRKLSGRKKKVNGVLKCWVGRLKKFIPMPQQRDYYLFGKKDMLFLLKDNNGLHHTLRIPTLKQMAKFYETMGVNIEENPKFKVFLLPNPHEDLNWLADELDNADMQFRSTWIQRWGWAVVPIVALFVSAMIFIMTMVLAKR